MTGHLNLLSKSRLLRRRRAIAAALTAALLVPPMWAPLGAQSPTPVFVPVRGEYTGEAVLTESSTWGMQIFPPSREGHMFMVEVNECADQIIVRHAQLPKGIVTRFSPTGGGHWEGEEPMEMGASFRLRLDPVSTTEIKARYSFNLPMVAHNQEWDIAMTNVFTPSDVPAGAGDLVEMARSEAQQRGLWVTEDVQWGSNIYDFFVNDAKLLFRHIETLDRVAATMTATGWTPQPDKVCHQRPAIYSSSPFYGFASKTGPESVNVGLADRRARNAREYLVPALASAAAAVNPELDPFVLQWLKAPDAGAAVGPDGELIRPVEGLDGVESDCNRSVQFFFTMREASLKMYTREDALDWLRADLEHIRDTFRPPYEPGSLEERTYRDVRWEATALYTLALNYLDLVEQGHCTPPGQRDPRAGRDSPENGCTSTHPGCLALNHSDDPRANLRKALEQLMFLRAGDSEPQLLDRMRADPWLEAGYRARSPEQWEAIHREERRLLKTCSRIPPPLPDIDLGGQAFPPC